MDEFVLARQQEGDEQVSQAANAEGGPDCVWKGVFERWLPRVILAVTLLGYAAFLGSRFAPAITAADANGYWAQASLLVKEGRTWFRPESPTQYIGMHWLVTPDGRYFSRYPPGLPVLIAAVYATFGPEASTLVNPVLALLSLVGFFILGSLLLGRFWGSLGAAILALTPYFSRHALTCDSHMAVTCLLIWGMVFLVRWQRSGSLWAVAAAGVLLGAIPTVRYPEALYALGIGVFLVWEAARKPRPFTHLAVAAGGALLPIVPLLVRNQRAFGAFWRTAYALTNEQTGFTWEYFRTHAVDYVRALNADGVGPLFTVAILAVPFMLARARRRSLGAMLILIVVPSTLLYMAYYWVPGRMMGGQGAAMRFVLPTFPCYVLAALWLLRGITARRSIPLRLSTAAVLVCVYLLWGIRTTSRETAASAHSRAALARLTSDLRAAVPEDAIIIAHSRILQHLDFVRRWRLVDLSCLRRSGRGRFLLAQEGDASRPMPMQREKLEAQGEHYSDLHPFGRERAVAYDIREWAGDSPVYFVGATDELNMLSRFYFQPEQFRTVATVQMPAPDDEIGRQAPGGAVPGMPPGGRTPAWQGANPPMAGPPARLRQRPGGRRAGRFGIGTDATELVIAEWLWQPRK